MKRLSTPTVAVVGLSAIALFTTQPTFAETTAVEGGRAEMHDHAEHAHAEMSKAAHADLIPYAVAYMTPTKGNQTMGTITFEAIDGGGVKVTAEVSGLEPNSKHGFHIHEFGDASSEDGKAMGGHYNPEGHDHALPTDSDGHRHAGDMGNLEADEDGNATYTMTFDNISIAGMTNPIIGRGVIIHAAPDDGGQPTGNAGARIAQGVIGVAKAPDAE